MAKRRWDRLGLVLLPVVGVGVIALGLAYHASRDDRPSGGDAGPATVGANLTAAQRKALRDWEVLPRPAGMSAGAPEHLGGRTREFAAVMVAFDVKEGDPPERLVSALGPPDLDGPARWYRMRWLGEGEPGTRGWALTFREAEPVPPGALWSFGEVVHARRYRWKSDEYVWPNPRRR